MTGVTTTQELLSTIERVPVSYFVYSSFSFLGAGVSGGLPGPWFVRTLAEAGRDEAAIRQTLFRMEREHELASRREGRTKFYFPSRYALAEIEAGTDRIFNPPVARWDRRWTMVHVGLRRPSLAKHRERLVALLAVEGFARVDANLFVHPLTVPARITKALPGPLRAEVLALRGDLAGREPIESLLALWHVDALATRYRAVARRLNAIEARMRRAVVDLEAFLLRFAVVFDYLDVAWEDPRLPTGLLPTDWPGNATRVLAAQLYERLLPGAIRYAESVLGDVSERIPSTRKGVRA